MKKKILLLGITSLLLACGGKVNWQEISEEKALEVLHSVSEEELFEMSAVGKRRIDVLNFDFEEAEGLFKNSYTSNISVDVDFEGLTCHVIANDEDYSENSENQDENYEYKYILEGTAYYKEGVGVIASEKETNGITPEENHKSSHLIVSEEEITQAITESGVEREFVLKEAIYYYASLNIRSMMWAYGSFVFSDDYSEDYWKGTIKNTSLKYYQYDKEQLSVKCDYGVEGYYDDACAEEYKVDYTQIDKTEMRKGIINYALSSYEEVGFYYKTDTELVDYKYGYSTEIETKEFVNFSIPSLEEYPLVIY